LNDVFAPRAFLDQGDTCLDLSRGGYDIVESPIY
jgi:hypothetical protein